MATWWMKSLHCKSRALDDVVQKKHKLRTNHSNTKSHPNQSHHHIIPSPGSCRSSVQSIKDVVETAKQGKPRKPKSLSEESPPPPPNLEIQPPAKVTKRSGSRKSEPASHQPGTRARPGGSRTSRSSESFFPALTELPEGHPSRNVVEIIFHTSWSPKAFTGRIEMVFKVQNLPRTVDRFEEYREIVKSRADSGVGLASDSGGEEDARCVADGNEVMRFYCLGPTSSGGGGGGAYDQSYCAWAFSGVKGTTICTFEGSGGAHESAGGGRGRRAMLVCRVIAGRVCKQLGWESLVEEGRGGYDSVSGENSELLVFDSRAVLPCFLVIYKL